MCLCCKRFVIYRYKIASVIFFDSTEYKFFNEKYFIEKRLKNTRYTTCWKEICEKESYYLISTHLICTFIQTDTNWQLAKVSTDKIILSFSCQTHELM